MIQEILQTADLTSILLVGALIAAFVIAFKVMEMIFDTMLIAGISATFYLGLRTIQGGSITINNLLLFTFLGATIYMVYSLLHSLYKVGTKVLPIPYQIIKTIMKPFQYAAKEFKELAEREDDYAPKKTRKSKEKEKKEEEKDEKDKTTKEVILGNKKDENEDEG